MDEALTHPGAGLRDVADALEEISGRLRTAYEAGDIPIMSSQDDMRAALVKALEQIAHSLAYVGKARVALYQLSRPVVIPARRVEKEVSP